MTPSFLANLRIVTAPSPSASASASAPSTTVRGVRGTLLVAFWRLFRAISRQLYTVQVFFLLYTVHVRCIRVVREHTYERFRPSLGEKEDSDELEEVVLP